MNQILKTKESFAEFMLSRGVHLGYNDWTSSCLYLGKRNKLSVFDLNRVIYSIAKVGSVFSEMSRAKKKMNILVVNTNPEYNELVKFFALSTGQNHVNNRWIGGTLTNWEKISRGIIKFQRLSRRFPQFDSKNPRYKKMKKSFNGFQQQIEKPDFIFLINSYQQQKILNEASSLQIPVIAFVDSNTPQKLITYPIYGNANSYDFVYFCLNLFLKIYNK